MTKTSLSLGSGLCTTYVFFLPSCFVVNKYYDSDSVDYGKLQNQRFFYSGYLYKIHNNREFTELVDQLHGFSDPDDGCLIHQLLHVPSQDPCFFSNDIRGLP